MSWTFTHSRLATLWWCELWLKIKLKCDQNVRNEIAQESTKTPTHRNSVIRIQNGKCNGKRKEKLKTRRHRNSVATSSENWAKNKEKTTSRSKTSIRFYSKWFIFSLGLPSFTLEYDIFAIRREWKWFEQSHLTFLLFSLRAAALRSEQFWFLQQKQIRRFKLEIRKFDDTIFLLLAAVFAALALMFWQQRARTHTAVQFWATRVPGFNMCGCAYMCVK